MVLPSLEQYAALTDNVEQKKNENNYEIKNDGGGAPSV